MFRAIDDKAAIYVFTLKIRIKRNIHCWNPCLFHHEIHENLHLLYKVYIEVYTKLHYSGVTDGIRPYRM